MTPRYRTLEDFAESLISDPSQRERLYFPDDADANDRPSWRFHGLLALIVLGAPVILAVVLMVVLARLRWGI